MERVVGRATDTCRRAGDPARVYVQRTHARYPPISVQIWCDRRAPRRAASFRCASVARLAPSRPRFTGNFNPLSVSCVPQIATIRRSSRLHFQLSLTIRGVAPVRGSCQDARAFHAAEFIRLGHHHLAEHPRIRHAELPSVISRLSDCYPRTRGRMRLVLTSTGLEDRASWGRKLAGSGFSAADIPAPRDVPRTN